MIYKGASIGGKFHQGLPADGAVGFLGVGFVNSVFVETKV